MSRGKVSTEGNEFTNANGYTYVKTPRGWRAKAHVVFEQETGEKVLPGQVIKFKDGDKQNFDPKNLERAGSKRSSLARITALVARAKQAKAEALEIMFNEIPAAEREEAASLIDSI